MGKLRHQIDVVLIDIKKSIAKQKELRRFISVTEVEVCPGDERWEELEEARREWKAEHAYSQTLKKWLKKNHEALEKYKQDDETSASERRRKEFARRQRISYAVVTRKLPPLPSELTKARKEIIWKIEKGEGSKEEEYRKRPFRIADSQREEFEKKRKK